MQETKENHNPDYVLKRIKYWAHEQPDKVAIRYCNGSGDVDASLTYKELNERTYFISQKLLAEVGLKENDFVMLVYPPSIDFIVIFLSCLRAGLIVVPVYPPDPNSLKKNLYLFESVQKNCGATVALTSSLYYSAKKLSSLKNMFSLQSSSKWPDMKWIVTDNYMKTSLSVTIPEDESFDHFSGDKLAFLQYTSGSTSLPKGVMISIKSLSADITVIIRALKADTSVVVCSWLPQYHDMGLIGSNLACLYISFIYIYISFIYIYLLCFPSFPYCGGSGVYFSPISFIKQPLLWLKLISKYHATHLQAPNFAYALVNKRLSIPLQSMPLDLSSVRHIFNAAEPIIEDTVHTFINNLKPYKLPAESMVGGYGLAENCVYVSDGGSHALHVEKEELELNGHVKLYNGDLHNHNKYNALYSCGNIYKNKEIEIIIVNADQKTKIEPDHVGEVWISGETCASGYYNQPELTEETFHAHLNGDDSRDYLKTGDQGFIHDDELYICGRVKDLIIIRGRNHYPQDIEISCYKDSNIKQGSIAAFSVQTSHDEALVIVTELKEYPSLPANENEYIEMIKRMANNINNDHGIFPAEIIILKSKTISKTTSGKITRNKIKMQYNHGELNIMYRYVFEKKEEAQEDEMIKEQEIEPVAENVEKVAENSEGILNNNNNQDNNNNNNQDNNNIINPQTQEAEMKQLFNENYYFYTPDGDKIEKPKLHGEDLVTSLYADFQSLQANGLDSLTVAQYSGYLQEYYGAYVEDEIMFDPAIPFKQVISIIDKQEDRDPAKIKRTTISENQQDSDANEANPNEDQTATLTISGPTTSTVNIQSRPNSYIDVKPPKKSFCDLICCRVK
ncbi:hypothetical protein WA158_000688 [Blastocystis sp. Blastoise]